MYLAGILGLCVLLLSPAPASAGGRAFLFADQQAPVTSQTPEQSPSQEQNQSIQPADQSPAGQGTAGTKKPAPKKKKTSHKKPTPPAGDEDPKKTVVRKGSTGEKTVQLTPAVNQAGASRQRETTKELLTSTDANLQKLSARQLSKDQQDTVAQIREFMQQAKTADAKGDLDRASKLAAKAHLLSEALANP